MIDYPQLSLEHLQRLTDETGIIQHAKYYLPNRATGYTTDDNARALIAATRAYRETGQAQALGLAERYLGFMHYAQLPNGQFHNLMGYDRRWEDEAGSEDSFGRALWSIGVATASLAGTGAGSLAKELFSSALPWALRLRSPRAWAFSLVGICEYLKAFERELSARQAVIALAGRLVSIFGQVAEPQWGWFEDRLAYSNAMLPAALFAAYEYTGDAGMLKVAEESLSFLTEVQWQGNYYKLVGCDGWYVRGGERALWDEQPEDAGCLVLAYCRAYRTTGDSGYLEYAETAMDWFYGRNVHGLPLYDPATGGCHDGLNPQGVNLNQGAESLLAYLLARIELTSLVTLIKKPALILGSDR